MTFIYDALKRSCLTCSNCIEHTPEILNDSNTCINKNTTKLDYFDLRDIEYCTNFKMVEFDKQEIQIYDLLSNILSMFKNLPEPIAYKGDLRHITDCIDRIKLTICLRTIAFANKASIVCGSITPIYDFFQIDNKNCAGCIYSTEEIITNKARCDKKYLMLDSKFCINYRRIQLLDCEEELNKLLIQLHSLVENLVGPRAYVNDVYTITRLVESMQLVLCMRTMIRFYET